MNKAVKISLIFFAILIASIATIYITVLMPNRIEKKKAIDFVKLISKGDTSTAYAQFSPALKKTQAQAVFEAKIAAKDLDESCVLSVDSLSSVGSASTGIKKEVSGRIKCDRKTYDGAVFTYNEDGLLVGYLIQQNATDLRHT